MVERFYPSTAVHAWNLATEAARDYDWYVLGADDVEWCPGWLDEALAVAKATGAHCIGLNDGDHTDLEQYAPHYMVTGTFLNGAIGGKIAPPHYLCWWFDREVCEVAKARGEYAPAWNAYAVHHHPDWHTAAMDDTYLEAWANHDIDKATYLTRKAERELCLLEY